MYGLNSKTKLMINLKCIFNFDLSLRVQNLIGYTLWLVARARRFVYITYIIL